VDGVTTTTFVDSVGSKVFPILDVLVALSVITEGSILLFTSKFSGIL